MKAEIIEKAWRVNPNKFESPWYCGDDIFYGTRGQAKSSAVADYHVWGKLISGEDVNFLNIPIIRASEQDKVAFEGEVIYRYQIPEKMRKHKIKQLPKDKMYYVQDCRNYVGNAVVWWGKDGGYVTDPAKAKKYTWKEIQALDPRKTDIVWESEHVERAVRKYVDMQDLDYGKYAI